MKKIFVFALLISFLLLTVTVRAETEVYKQGWDFGGGTLYEDYIYAVGDVYDETLGWGWNASVQSLNRGISDTYYTLNQDFCYSRNPANFTVRVPHPGEYNVTVWSGDSSWCLDVVVYVEGAHQFDLEGDGSGGLWLHNSTTVTVNDGYLSVSVHDKGTYGDANWRINGLLIELISQIDVLPVTVHTTVRNTELKTSMVTTTITKVDTYNTRYTSTNETIVTSTELSTETLNSTFIVIDENITVNEIGTVNVNVVEQELFSTNNTAILIIATVVVIIIAMLAYYKRRQ